MRTANEDCQRSVPGPEVSGQPCLKHLSSCWLQHSFWTALLLSLLVMGFGLGLDWLLLGRERCRLVRLAGLADCILGLAVFLLLYRLLTHARRRQQRILDRVQIIDEMNHHVRSALQVISFNVRPAAGNEWELAEIRQSIERIHWALREILPRVEPEFQPFDGGAKRPESKAGE